MSIPHFVFNRFPKIDLTRILAFVFLFVASHGVFAEDKLYWADAAASLIMRSNLDGSNPETLCDSSDFVSSPSAIAIDVSGGKIYWFENSVYSSNLFPPCTRTEVFTATDFSTSDIEFDSVNQKLYWISNSKQFQRANVDGSSLETFTNFTLTGTPSAIALDPDAGYIYFVERNGSNEYVIRRANMDKTGSPVDIYNNSTGTINGLTIDPNLGFLYFTDQSFEIIKRVKTDGSGVTDLLINPFAAQPFGITIDLQNNDLYWSDNAGDQLKRTHADGTSTSTILNPTGTSIRDVEIAQSEFSAITAFHPSGNGSFNQFDVPVCSALPNWQCVNDQTSDATEGPVEANDVSTYIESTGVFRETFTLVDNPASIPAGATITSLTVYAQTGRATAGAGPQAALSYQRIGTDGAPVDSTLVTETVKDCCSNLMSATWSGLSWSVTDFNNLEIGIYHDGAGTFHFSQIYATVSYSFTPSGTYSISGRVFKDGDFDGSTIADYDSGINDTNLETVFVELYDILDNYITTVQTNASGYTFSSLPNGTYKVRTRAASLSGLPEMVGAYQNGSYQAKLGGADAAVSDTVTANDSGPGDNYTVVSIAGGNISNVNFGFAYNLIVNANTSGQGSLDQFIQNANAGLLGSNTTSQFNMQVATNRSNGSDNWWGIGFASGSGGLTTITANNFTIDGSTQATDNNSLGPEIEVYCSNCVQFDTPFYGFDVNGASGVTVNNFILGGFGVGGIAVRASANNITIKGNYIGTNGTGDAIASPKIFQYGVYINASSNVTIGANTASERNIISGVGSGGTDDSGIFISGASSGITIDGNYIGTDRSGTNAIANNRNGIQIKSSSTGTIATITNNIVSGNSQNAIRAEQTNGTLTIQNNKIGTSVSGGALANGTSGIYVQSAGTPTLTIGGLSGEGNLIASNTLHGIDLSISG
ncbi:MAG: hypothetical protein OEY38_07100, partial [Gammaproteobacteria bacterium]|nr:hypothetical protein [Gammaproteobacteria bacterium]